MHDTIFLNLQTRSMHSWWCTSLGELQVLSKATWWKATIHFGYGYFRIMFLMSVPLLIMTVMTVLTRNYIIICRSISAPSTVEWTAPRIPMNVIGTPFGGIFYTTGVYLHVLCMRILLDAKWMCFSFLLDLMCIIPCFPTLKPCQRISIGFLLVLLERSLLYTLIHL